MLSTKDKGDIAVSEAINFFIKNQIEVCLPFGDKRDYDLVIEKEDKLHKVQVKYAGIYKSRNNQCKVGLRITGGNKSNNKAKKYDDNAFDYLFVYSEKGERYLIPWEEVSVRNELYIEHLKYQRYNVSSAQG